MALAGFATAVFAALFWALLLLFVTPRLLARLFCVIVSNASQRKARISVRAMYIYVLSGTVVARGMKVSVPDAVVDVEELVLVCRWWLPWRQNILEDDKEICRPWKIFAKHPKRNGQENSVKAAATLSVSFPAVFCFTLVGVRVRLINNTTVYDRVHNLITAMDNKSTLDIRNPITGMMPTDTGIRHESPMFSAESWLSCLLNHVSVRLHTGAIYVSDMRDMPLLRFTFDTAKFRVVIVPPVVRNCIRRDTIQLTVSRFAVGVSENLSPSILFGSDGARGHSGSLQNDIDQQTYDHIFPRRTGCMPGWLRTWQEGPSRALRCHDFFVVQKLVCQYIADVATDAIADRASTTEEHSPHSGEVEQQKLLTVSLDGAQIEYDQECISAAAEVCERYFPSLFHLETNADRELEPDRFPSPSQPSLLVKFSGTCLSPGVPLVVIPFVPRESTWELLRVVGIQRDSQTIGQSIFRFSQKFRFSETKESLCTRPNRLNIYSSSFSGSFLNPVPSSGSLWRGNMQFSDIRASMAGALNAPLLRSSRVDLVYEEVLPNVWNGKRDATLFMDYSDLQALYLADISRIFEEIFDYIATQSRLPADVRFFVPYDLRVTMRAINGYSLRFGAEKNNAWRSLERTLDEVHDTVLELRGQSGTLTASSTSGLEYLPVVSSMQWTLDISNSELFILIPVSYPTTAASAKKDSQAMRFGRLVRARASTRSNLRLVNSLKLIFGDAASTMLRLRAVSGTAVPVHQKIEQSAEDSFPNFTQSARITVFKGSCILSGLSISCSPGFPQSFSTSTLSVNAESILFDMNPFHIPHGYNACNNVMESFTHALSTSELEVLKAERETLTSDILRHGRRPTGEESLMLGLDPGVLGVVRAYAPKHLSTTVTMDIGDLRFRLHDLPDRRCFFRKQYSDVPCLILGQVTFCAKRTRHGSTMELAPKSLNDHAIICSSANASSFRNGLTHPPKFSHVRIQNWRAQRHYFFDNDAAPYYRETSVFSSKINGLVDVRDVASLISFSAVLQRVQLDDVSPALEALQLLSVSIVDVDELDLSCWLGELSSASKCNAVCHLMLARGFRACSNNKCHGKFLTQALGDIPQLMCNVRLTSSEMDHLFAQCFLHDQRCETNRGTSKGSKLHERRSMGQQPFGRIEFPLKDILDIRCAAVRGLQCQKFAEISSSFAVSQRQRVECADGSKPRVTSVWRTRTAAQGALPYASAPNGAGWWQHYMHMLCVHDRDIPSGTFDRHTVIRLLLRSDLRVVLTTHCLDFLSTIHQQLATCVDERNTEAGMAKSKTLCEINASNDGSTLGEDELIDIWRTLKGIQYHAALPNPPNGQRSIHFNAEGVSIIVLSPTSAADMSRLPDSSMTSREFLLISMSHGMQALTAASHVSGGETVVKSSSDSSSVELPTMTVSSSRGKLCTLKSAKFSRHDRTLSDHAAAQKRQEAHSCVDFGLNSLQLDLGNIEKGTLVECGWILALFCLETRVFLLKTESTRQSMNERLENMRHVLFGGPQICNLDEVEYDEVGAILCVASARAHADRELQLTDAADSQQRWQKPVTELISCRVSSERPTSRYTGPHSPPLEGFARKCSDLLPVVGSDVDPSAEDVIDAQKYTANGSFRELEVTICGENLMLARNFSVTQYATQPSGQIGEYGITKVSLESTSLSLRDDVLSEILQMCSLIAARCAELVPLLPLFSQSLQGMAKNSSVANMQTTRLNSTSRVSPADSRRGTVPVRCRSESENSNDQTRGCTSSCDAKTSEDGMNPQQVGNLQSSANPCDHTVRKSQTRSTSAGDVSADARARGHNRHKSRSWWQRLANAAENALHTTTSVAEDSVHGEFVESISRSRPVEKVSTPQDTQLIVSLGKLMVSYRHSRVSRGTVMPSSYEPDLQLVVNRSAVTSVISASSTLKSTVLTSAAISMMSKNEFDCVFRGSIGYVRVCCSVPSREHVSAVPDFLISLQLGKVEISLEAADLASVQMFQKQFRSDTKRIGESMMLAQKSFRELLRATEEASVIASFSPVPASQYGPFSLSVHVECVSCGLIGFHPADKAMRIAHEASSASVSASFAKSPSALLLLGGHVKDHSVVVSASKWSNEERFDIPSIQICGIQWSLQTDLPTHLQLTSGPLDNVITLHALRNMLFVVTGLLAFQSREISKLDLERGNSSIIDGSIIDGSITTGFGAEEEERITVSSRLSCAVHAYERTKAVRMEFCLQPMSTGFSSGDTVARFELCNIDGVVEWNRNIVSGPQLRVAVVAPAISLTVFHALRFASPDHGQRSRDNSLSILLDSSRIDILKLQHGALHRFVVRLFMKSLQAVLKPWDFMARAASWADEQSLTREIQRMYSSQQAHESQHTAQNMRSSVPSQDEHRLIEFGTDLPLAVFRVPLEFDASRQSSVIGEFHESRLRVRLGDDLALPSQLNLAKLRIRSVDILHEDVEVLRASHSQCMFAVKRSPLGQGAYLGSLRGVMSPGTWVLRPRQKLVLAIIDARLSEQARLESVHRRRELSTHEQICSSGALKVRSHTQDQTGNPRVIFERVEVLVQPSPGFIEGISEAKLFATHTSSHSPRGLAGEPTDSKPPLQLPLPLFSIGIVRNPAWEFDLVDLDFSRRKKRDEFPEGCIKRVANVFSELYGAVASKIRVGYERNISADTTAAAQSQSSAAARNARSVSDPIFARGWSAILRFGESKYVAREGIFGNLRTRFSFYAGAGSGVLVSTVDPSHGACDRFAADDVFLNQVTIVAAVSPMFQLDIHPELESSSPQSMMMKQVRAVQGFANGIPSYTAVHISEMKAELDVITLLLSREWAQKQQKFAVEAAPRSQSHHETIPQSAQQAALALASATPTQAKAVVVFGNPIHNTQQQESERQSRLTEEIASQALLVRLRLSQPEGRVGLKVRHVQIGFARDKIPKNGQDCSLLTSDLHLAVYNVRSLADWEHLSYDCGFHSLRVRLDSSQPAGKIPRTQAAENRLTTTGLALVLHHLRVNCKRGESDALKFELGGGAFASCVRRECVESLLDTTQVYAYISSSTVKTINRLVQLKSRLLRGLRPQVERMHMTQFHRAKPRAGESLDSSNNDLSFEDVLQNSSSSAVIDKWPTGDSREEIRTEGHVGTKVNSLDVYRNCCVPGKVLISGDRLLVTMHGFSFDDNQPQAKLLFVSYDLDYIQRSSTGSDHECFENIESQIELDQRAVFKSMGLRYQLFEVQYSDQRQKTVTVMSLPDPHLTLRVLETTNLTFVEFVTRFDAPMETSPYVSHYDYLRKLLLLYRSVTTTSLVRTFSEIALHERKHKLNSDSAIFDDDPLWLQDIAESDGWLSSQLDMTGGQLPNKASEEQASGAGPISESHTNGNSVSDEEQAAIASKLPLEASLVPPTRRWGGKRVAFSKLVFSPRLRALGDLTPKVDVVLGWLGVGGIDALPAGLYDIVMSPLSRTIDVLKEAQSRDRNVESRAPS